MAADPADRPGGDQRDLLHRAHGSGRGSRQARARQPGQRARGVAGPGQSAGRRDRLEFAWWSTAFQARAAGEPGDLILCSGTRAREPRPGAAHPERRHARGARCLQGEAPAGLHRSVTAMTVTGSSGKAAVEINFPVLETLTFEVLDGDIGVLRINRPDRMNSQTVTMFSEYGEAAFALRDTALRALILTATGERAFCAGFDLDELDVITRMGVREFLKFQETAAGGIQAIRHLPFPVIAAIHGPAIGGGLALALAADIRLASPAAKFSAAFLKVGLSVGELGTSYNLTRLIGPGRAAEIGYTGRVVEAAEAARIGLVNRVIPADKLFGEALAMARLIATNSPGGVRMSKRAIQRNQEVTSYAAALELENRGQALLTRTDDMPEALAAFKEKREPRFTGR